ncbi:hypothetical protein LPJ78_003427 [Coemansia sp. RSA 989]|nr:hypothetical protein LPJ68_004986 [Coemansia sp. RSA 1086]KAJ1750083.1 hypothetical protein LPJ79_003181 [Coemansia sp. RSA 1821]KAJ1864336.1 hypothetical protein LPJ78_003427 [Coemansia sp. RSA 989]KAJ1874307.1 hypothetical protein LPJ55_001553 [Coemansia sp. RSA 990]KAJ2629224.1 hypothetical protein H4R22_003448 [Coemansia sp. RSA 1290]KAJ2649502.1 hypothetical protein IWW40_003175 [Coemansia sp. RSA 1250]KAJ2670733.1 hypothetical protein IWW42_003765 [Coemansia sp. RSA 1085]
MIAAAQPDILGYAFTAIKALLEVFLIGLSGYIFARNGTLSKSTLKSLSLISVNLLTPALMFSKMTETLDPGLLLELWNEPVFYFIYGGFSLLWSRVGSRMLRLNSDYARLCDVATFFSNTNTLPVSLIKSIALSSGSHFLLKDANDTPLKVAARGVSYAMIFATLNNILRWSFGVALMGGLSPKNKSAFNSVNATPRTPAPANFDRSSQSSDELVPLFLGEPAQPLLRHPAGLQRITNKLSGMWATIRTCITPPVYAILAAFIVITIKPLHETFMNPNTLLYTLWSAIDMCGDACVPLILISLGGQLGMMKREKQQSALSTETSGAQQCGICDQQSDSEDSTGITRAPSSAQLGDVATYQTQHDSTIPSIVVRSATESGAQSAVQLHYHCSGHFDLNSMTSAEQRKGIVLVLVGRFVFVPTLAIILISTLRIVFPSLLPIMSQDPVYILTLLILSSTPPAINLITVSQATGKFETEAAQILFYGYILGIFVLAIEVSGFLWLTSALSNM